MTRPIGRRALPAVALLAGFAGLCEGTTVSTVVANGSPARRIDMVIMGDRYTTADMAKFRSDVDRIVARFKNQSPWKEYMPYVNVHRVEVVSPSGTEAGPLKSSFSGRCWSVDAATVNSYAALAPDNEIRYVLVNSTTFGGCATYGGVAAGYAGTSTDPYWDWVAIHEVGHQFGLLADEYHYDDPPETYTGSEPTQPNATTKTDRATTKWARWIAGTTPIPTPATYTTVIGLFQGCNYKTYGIYRPKFDCLMRSLQQGNCEVCREQIVKRLYTEGNPVDGIASSSGSFSVPQNRSVNLTAAEIAPHALGYAWTVDGVYRGGDAVFAFSGASYAKGIHTVKVVVTDQTPFVRGATLTGSFERAITVVDPVVVNPFPMAVRVTASALNVRSGPGTGYPILGVAPNGQVWIAHEKTSTGWYRVSYEGKSAYLYGAYVVQATGVNGAKVNVAILNVRTGPGTGYTKIGESHLGEIYRIEASSGGGSTGWHQIRWNVSTAAWLYGGYAATVAF